MRFRNRTEAGQRLAERLARYANRADVVVLGLPRGGVPVAAAVVRALNVSLDIVVSRKLGAPGEPELAMGAVASGGARVLNDEVIRLWNVSPRALEAATAHELSEVIRREHLYRQNRPLPRLTGRTVILVDDGIATGATIRAAIAAVRRQQPARLIVAAPVAAAETCAALRVDVDELVCVLMPNELYGVGLWYDDFPQVSDDTVRQLLMQAWALEEQRKQSQQRVSR